MLSKPNSLQKKLAAKLGKVLVQFPETGKITDFSGVQLTPNVVVSAKGDGHYTNLSDAVKNIPSKAQGRYVIYVKSGVYDVGSRSVVISRSQVTLFGDGKGKTLIRSNLNAHSGQSIEDSAAVAIMANNFMAKDVTFENTSGADKEQAVALRSDGDESVFYRCEFLGYQDTLYVNFGRQFFRECDVLGSVDFIFGDARMVLQKCDIKFRRPRQGGANVITAQGRLNAKSNTGIVIHRCSITGPNASDGFLGRPWKKFARVVVMETFIDDVLDPSGWLEMMGHEATAVVREHDNRGPGASVAGRVAWPGFKVITDADEAREYTVGVFIDGGQWLAKTGVPFDLGLEL